MLRARSGRHFQRHASNFVSAIAALKRSQTHLRKKQNGKPLASPSARPRSLGTLVQSLHGTEPLHDYNQICETFAIDMMASTIQHAM